MVLWLNKFARPDIGYAASLIAQHAAKPTNGAFEASGKLVRYCASTPKLAIRQDLTKHVECQCQLFSDSDMAGNAEPGNKRRSQLGYVRRSPCWGRRLLRTWSSKSVAGAVQSSSLARLQALPAARGPGSLEALRASHGGDAGPMAP
jgi:hypothetical protein